MNDDFFKFFIFFILLALLIIFTAWLVRWNKNIKEHGYRFIPLQNIEQPKTVEAVNFNL
jgi:hypothetical protein